MSKDSWSESYKESGVDIEAGYEAVERMKKHIVTTKNEGVMDNIGSFGGLYDLAKLGYKDPLLVSGTDGVGTKLKLAFLLNKHDTIGIDAVAMCVNDIAALGARPLFFLDYIACGKNHPEVIEEIVKGVCEGCRQSGSALIGGETAEMPGFYKESEYDLAGFSVGIVEREQVINAENIKEDDVIIAIPSSGVHSNGFSLVRKVFDLENPEILNKEYEALSKPLGEALLTPTKIYVNDILNLQKEVKINSIAHITGGGFYENIPRALPEGKRAVVEKKKLRIPEIFNIIQKEGNITSRDMFNTFNMGVGMIVIVDKKDERKALSLIPGSHPIGKIITGTKGIDLW